MCRASSSKSQMNSRPVPSFVKLRPSLVNTVIRGPKRVRRTVGIKVTRCDSRALCLQGRDTLWRPRVLAPGRAHGFGIKPDFASRTPQECWHSGGCVAVQATFGGMIQAGRLLVDLDAGLVSVDDQPVHLTGKEYAVLELLSSHKGTTVTKEMLLNHLYGGVDEPELKIID